MSERVSASPNDWYRLIHAAHERIRPFVLETPLETAFDLLPGASARVFFKREDLQQTGSFKLRGATNKILSLDPGQAARGVIAASNGNHGLGVAAAAKRAGIATEVYVSAQVSPAKAQRIEELGARLHRAGEDPLAAELAARAAAEASGKVFISPYNDVEVMAGQGTIAIELQRQLPMLEALLEEAEAMAGQRTIPVKPQRQVPGSPDRAGVARAGVEVPVLDAVFVAVGGGGLIGGIGAWLKSTSLGTEIVGCWPENSRVLYESIKAGQIVDYPEQPTLSESTAGGLEPGSVTLEVCSRFIDHSVLVTEAEILSAMRRVQRAKGWLMEGAAGVAVAAFLKEARHYAGKNVVIIICGGNVSPELQEIAITKGSNIVEFTKGGPKLF
jgi:threonine dehydratase